MWTVPKFSGATTLGSGLITGELPSDGQQKATDFRYNAESWC